MFRGNSDLAATLRTRPPRTILVVVTRRIGDVLLATPLIRSLKRAWPGAAVDCLVFEGTQRRPIEPSLPMGACNEAVYGDWLGRSAEELAALRGEGVIS